jgi:hypothetical protein
MARQVLSDLWWVNGVWGAVNLFPMYPLDGGQALRAALRHWWKDRAETLALLISLGVSLAVSLWMASLQRWWAMIMTGAFALSNISQLLGRQRKSRNEALTMQTIVRVRNKEGARATVGKMRAHQVELHLLVLLERTFREAGWEKEADETAA